MGPEAAVPVEDDADPFREQVGDERGAVVSVERLLHRSPLPLDDRDAALLADRPLAAIAPELLQGAGKGVSRELASLVGCADVDVAAWPGGAT